MCQGWPHPYLLRSTVACSARSGLGTEKAGAQGRRFAVTASGGAVAAAETHNAASKLSFSV